VTARGRVRACNKGWGAIKGAFSYYIYIYIECGPHLTGNNRIIRHFNGASDGFFGNSLTHNIQ